MTRFDALWPALHRALQEAHADLTALFRTSADLGELPSPWATWTLVCLVRHRRRQLWVAEVVVERLGGELKAIATRGAFGHPAHIAARGLVPGLTEWEYDFHGKGCCLTHRGTGAAIDVDFFEPSGEVIDVFFFLRYLQSLRDPEPPEARLIALHRSWDSLRLAVDELLAAGVLDPLNGREAHAFRIAEQVLGHEDALDAFCAAWERTDRQLWLAAVVGDWLAAHERARKHADADLLAQTASQAAACRAARSRELQARWDDEAKRGEVLLALDDLDAEILADRLIEALSGPIGDAAARAVQIIARRDDPGWCDAIHTLFHRLDPGEELPRPYLWADCIEFLLRHGYRGEEMRAALTEAGGLAIGKAALLALEYDPSRALPLLRRGLRSPIPLNRTSTAATLALIDRPWSRRELLAVLGETDDQAATADCRAALLECHDAEARAAVLAWEEANPYEPQPGSFTTIGEWLLRNRSQWIRWEMEKLHEKVMRVRDREPAGADGP